MKNKTAVFTIISKNYISQAKALMDSLAKTNPELKRFVLLVDKKENYNLSGNYQLIELGQLKINGLRGLLFKYDITESNTFLKPYFIEYLFKMRDFDKVIYLDPDIYVFSRMDALYSLLKTHNIVLIPHILSPTTSPPDNLSFLYSSENDPYKIQYDLAFLQTGVYNLGFIALSKSKETLRMLQWWKDRLSKLCYLNPERGLFVDQKWIDLVPCYFDKVAILKDKTYNIAYWNLFERHDLRKSNDKFLLGNKKIVFFHFSGLSLEHKNMISTYMSKYRFKDFNKTLKKIFDLYVREIINAGYNATKCLRYYYGYYDNGVKITDSQRMVYSNCKNIKKFGDPFKTGKNGFFEWLRQPSNTNPHITNFQHELYKFRTGTRRPYIQKSSMANVTKEIKEINKLMGETNKKNIRRVAPMINSAKSFIRSLMKMTGNIFK